MEKAMTKLEPAPAAFFPALLLRAAAIGRETFDECLRIAYATAMLQMARPSGRPGLADPEDGPGEPGRDSERSVSRQLFIRPWNGSPESTNPDVGNGRQAT